MRDGRTADISPEEELEAILRGILKRYDRIGFGRRGVLDADAEIRRAVAGLRPEARACLPRLLLGWLDADTAALWATSLHYNLPEHVQALAIRLCGGLRLTESLPLLEALSRAGTFASDEAHPCRAPLQEALVQLRRES